MVFSLGLDVLSLKHTRASNPKLTQTSDQHNVLLED